MSLISQFEVRDFSCFPVAKQPVVCVPSIVSVEYIFFFSSRRRHTRCSRDWSSDVCSSDLFDGKRFFNPDAPQVPGFGDVIRWKLTSRPEPSPSFIPDVEPSQPPPRVNGNALDRKSVV